MACSTASGAVLTPPTTSTRGMMCGGLNGWPTRIRSGCLHADCITLGVIREGLLHVLGKAQAVARCVRRQANFFELLPGLVHVFAQVRFGVWSRVGGDN